MPDTDGGLREEFALHDANASKQEDKGKKADFRPIIETIARSRSTPFEVFSDFVRMAACALACQTREDEYLEIAKRYSRKELGELSRALALLVTEMEGAPFTDILGPYYIEVGSKFSRDLRGEFYTPQPVGEAMARMLVDAPKIIAEGRPITVCDPASGSGGLLLSVAREFAQAKAVDLLRVTCQDISKIACDMAYVNMTLWGIPARIVQGDTLRGTVDYEWKNIHWFRVGEHDRERIQAFMRIFKEDRSVPENDPVEPEDPTPAAERTEGGHGQQEWVFE